jgi:hypothetical protein
VKESIEKKGIKFVDLLELSKIGIKLAIDEPCIPIQVHAIVPTKVKEKIMPPIEFLSTGYSKLIAYHHNAAIHDIKAKLDKNSHKINYLRGSLNSGVNSIKLITKQCVMMHNRVEQIISLQNKLYEHLISKEKQVFGVNTRGGSATQDPDFPKGHPKRKEQDALNSNKASAGKSPNGNKFKECDKDQEQDTSI